MLSVGGEGEFDRKTLAAPHDDDGVVGLCPREPKATRCEDAKPKCEVCFGTSLLYVAIAGEGGAPQCRGGSRSTDKT